MSVSEEGGRVNITDELRTEARGFGDYVYKPEQARRLRIIADRIDAEHERQLEALYRDMSDAEYVKLPVDADGVPWHLGDELTMEGEVCDVVGIGDKTIFYAFGNGVDWTIAHNNRHHKQPTVEDVLSEFTDAILEWSGKSGTVAEVGTWSDVAAEYAAKLRLRGDEE